MDSTVVICFVPRVICLAALLLLLGDRAGRLCAAEPVTIRFKAAWPDFPTGAAGDVHVVQDLAYLSLDHAGLLIMDIRDPTAPRMLGGVRLRGTGPVAVSGRWAFLGVSGLQAIDVSNPLNPILAARHDLGTVRGLASFGTHVCAVGDHGFSILTAGQEEAPVLLATMPEMAAGVRVAAAGDQAYVIEGSTLHIIEVREPARPYEVGRLVQEEGWPLVGLAVDGALVFLADEWGWRVVDVMEPDSPLVLSETIFPEALRGLRPQLAAAGGYLYAGSYDSVVVYDVANAAAPREVFHLTSPMADPGWVTGALGGIRGLQLIGDRLVLPRDHDGLEIVSLLDPSRPVSAGLVRTDYDVRGVKAAGNNAYLVTYPFGLVNLNLSDTERPVVAGEYACPVLNQDHVCLEADGTHVYLQAAQLGLAVVDFAVPPIGGPERYRQMQWPGSVPGLWKANRSLLVTDYLEESDWFALTSYDLRNPNFPSKEWETGIAEARTVLGCVPQSVRFQYRPGPLFWRTPEALLRFDRNLTVFRDGAAVASPALALEGCHDFIAGNDGYVWLGGDGIRCVDLRDLAHPVDLGRIYAGAISGMALAGDVLVITGPEGLKVLDAAPGGDAAVLGEYAINGLGDVAMAGSYAVAARGPEGVVVLDLGPVGRTPPRIVRQPERFVTIVGATATFEVVAEGALPLSYQWRVNGIEMPGATNSTLALAKVGLDKNGRVQVTVNNALGQATSVEALLRVDIPPEIHVLSPESGHVYAPGDTAAFIVVISDADGPLPTAEFYVNEVKKDETGLPVGRDPPTFVFFVENLKTGVTELRARARDSDGITTSADPVRIIVTNTPLLQLAHAEYVGREKDGAVTVTVRRNVPGPCSVEVATEGLSARPVGARGAGQFYPVSTTLQFAPLALQSNVTIRLVDNLIYQGSRTFRVRLSEPSAGWALAAPSEALVTIEDDDPPSQTNLWTEVVAPEPPPAKRGSLQVRLEPPEALGRWRFLWETRWRDDGEVATGLVPGNYTTVFQPRAGFLAPLDTTNVIGPGAAEQITERYVAMSREQGGLSMTLLPGLIADGPGKGQWRLQGNAGDPWQSSGAILDGLPAGLHLVEFKPVPGFDTPRPQLITVVGGQTVVRRANYLLDVEETSVAWEPAASVAQVTDTLTNGWPLAFAGRLLSDAGSASGFVVKPRTVLTAAHAIFNGADLSYAEHAWWFFEAHRGEYEPVPQSPRGSYVFAGYAAARTNDVSSGGLNPGESSVDSLGLDVAALYFFEDAGRGGFGGFLVSGPEHDWLGGTELKLALGYPVERVAEQQQGRLHYAGPARFLFQTAVDSLDYTEELRAPPGSSGGPVCVLWTNSLGRPFYFPAAVQLGGTGRLVVRWIDLDVADLIGRSEQSSNGGANSTGGGIISVIAGNAGAARRAGLLSIRVGPPAAVRLGGAWRVSPTNSGELGELRNHTVFTNEWTTLAVLSSNLSLEIRPLPGFGEPAHQVVRVVEDANVLLDLNYDVTPPRWVSDPVFGPGLVGTAGTCYRIESKTSETATEHWLPVQQVALEPGTNWLGVLLPPESMRRIYRAVWLSE